MSGNNIKINERSVEGNKALDETTFVIPREVVEDNKAVEAIWRDDNEEMASEIDEATGLSALETYENEKDYQSPSDDEIANPERFSDQEHLSEIIRRAKAQKVGRRLLSLPEFGMMS